MPPECSAIIITGLNQGFMLWYIQEFPVNGDGAYPGGVFPGLNRRRAVRSYAGRKDPKKEPC